ncbi:hypothetical protein Vadar_002410 [Vaccinium darrowii]|uniref:Uncharacterized protein n=1 Tax=Vaccinium darrowii TaxID=229202 RepID=A0ACB7WWX0_9ERIC|nr:hypothetical protein Vadar_002410 [Vaccinium darrowii]
MEISSGVIYETQFPVLNCSSSKSMGVDGARGSERHVDLIETLEAATVPNYDHLLIDASDGPAARQIKELNAEIRMLRKNLEAKAPLVQSEQEVDVDSILPESFELSLSNGSKFNIKVWYPWRPLKCEKCMVFGHKTCQVVNLDVQTKVWQVKGKAAVVPSEPTVPAFVTAAMVPQLPLISVPPAVTTAGDNGSASLGGKSIENVDTDVVAQKRSSLAPSTSHGTMVDQPFPETSNQFAILRGGDAVGENNIILPSEDELTAITVNNVSPEVPKKKGQRKGQANATLDKGGKPSNGGSDHPGKGGGDQLMVTEISTVDGKGNFVLSLVYGHNKSIDRRVLWSEMRNICSVVGSRPWIQLGDFNSVRSISERLDGFDVSAATEFNECLNDIFHDDMPAKGFWFTWSNKRGGSGANKSCIDRVTTNTQWLATFPSAEAVFHAPGVSDHCPVTVTMVHGVPLRRPFKFFNFWLKNSGFKDTLIRSWNMMTEGGPMFRLSAKLKRLKLDLKQLNLSCYSNISKRVMEAKAELVAVQQQCFTTPHDIELCNNERALLSKARNTILSLTDSDGNTLEEPEAIKKEILDYYIGLLGTSFVGKVDATAQLSLAIQSKIKHCGSR